MTSVPPTILVRVSPQEQEVRGQQVEELGKNLSWRSEISLSAIWTSVVKADFLKAVRKAVSKRLIRLLKGCYM